jgi:signal peptidase I
MGEAEGREEKNEAGRPGGGASGGFPGPAEGDGLAVAPAAVPIKPAPLVPPDKAGSRSVEPESVRSKSLWREYTEAIVIAVVLALFIRTFVVQAFKIPSGSMLSTLQIGDHILVNKMLYGLKIPVDCEWDFTSTRPGVRKIPLLWSCYSYKTVVPLGSPERGDIVVFMFPEDETKDFIKRAIGLPGDTVEVRNKRVLINGEPLQEPYTQHVDPNMAGHPRDNLGPLTVPPDSYFVMGDNRDQSLDSRFWGFVKRDKIKGKAFIIYWSWDAQGDPNRGVPPKWVRWDRIGRIIH